jgi:histidinol-phosphatase (PHP family)
LTNKIVFFGEIIPFFYLCSIFVSKGGASLRKDGHIHSPYCPHGTKDSFQDYVERAITLGFEEISFTEHAPLPPGFSDPTPAKDSGMDKALLDDYFKDIEKMKNLYRSRIKINCGLEIDFIEGFEEETINLLQEFGPRLDDAILSVHFLKHENGYDCMDYSPEVFGKMVNIFGSIESLYQKYYETLLKSIKADLGSYKPKRIGHITLVHKFKKKFPVIGTFEDEIDELLAAMKEKGCELDYNGAGTVKPLCGEPYPPNWIIKKAVTIGIPLIYGSDAHQKKELGQGREQMIHKNLLI